MLYKYLCRNCLELIRIVSNLFTYSNFTFYLLLYFTCVFHSSSLIMSISFRSFTDRWPGLPWEINPINDLLITILESAYVAIGNLYKPEAVRQKKKIPRKPCKLLIFFTSNIHFVLIIFVPVLFWSWVLSI